MECPTPCICGRIVELDDMYAIDAKLPDGGNLVCKWCHCDECDGTGECGNCDDGECPYCCNTCGHCKGTGDCKKCNGRGYKIHPTWDDQ